MAGPAKNRLRQKVAGGSALKRNGSWTVRRLWHPFRIRRGVPKGCGCDANRFPPQSLTLLFLVTWRVRQELAPSIFPPLSSTFYCHRNLAIVAAIHERRQLGFPEYSLAIVERRSVRRNQTEKRSTGMKTWFI